HRALNRVPDEDDNTVPDLSEEGRTMPRRLPLTRLRAAHAAGLHFLRPHRQPAEAPAAASPSRPVPAVQDTSPPAAPPPEPPAPPWGGATGGYHAASRRPDCALTTCTYRGSGPPEAEPPPPGT